MNASQQWDLFFGQYPPNLNNLLYFDDPHILKALKASASSNKLSIYDLTDTQTNEFVKYILITFPQSLLDAVSPFFFATKYCRLFKACSRERESIKHLLSEKKIIWDESKSVDVWLRFLNIISKYFEKSIDDYPMADIAILRSALVHDFDSFAKACGGMSASRRCMIALLVYRFGGSERFLSFTSDIDSLEGAVDLSRFSVVVSNRAMAYWHLGNIEACKSLFIRYVNKLKNQSQFSYNYGRFLISLGEVTRGHQILDQGYLKVDGSPEVTNFGSLKKLQDSDENVSGLFLWGREGVNDQLIQSLCIPKFLEGRDIEKVYLAVHGKLVPLLQKMFPKLPVREIKDGKVHVPKEADRHLSLSDLPLLVRDKFVFRLKVPKRQKADGSLLIGLNWRSHIPVDLRTRGGPGFYFPTIEEVCDVIRAFEDQRFVVLQPALTEVEREMLTSYPHVSIPKNVDLMLDDLRLALRAISELDALVAQPSVNATLASIWRVPCCSWVSKGHFKLEGTHQINPLDTHYVFYERSRGIDSCRAYWVQQITMFLKNIGSVSSNLNP